MKTSYILLVVVATFLFSCQRKKCKDSTADNYNVKDVCECCSYSGAAVFWFDSETSDSMIANGITSLYLQKGFLSYTVKTNSPYNYSNSAPSCNTSGAWQILEEWSSKSGTQLPTNYTVRGETNSGSLAKEWSGSLNIEAKDCQSVKLEW